MTKSSVRKPQRPDFCSAQLNSSCEHDGEVSEVATSIIRIPRYLGNSTIQWYSSTKFSTSIRSRSTRVDLLCTLRPRTDATLLSTVQYQSAVTTRVLLVPRY